MVATENFIVGSCNSDTKQHNEYNSNFVDPPEMTSTNHQYQPKELQLSAVSIMPNVKIYF